MTSKMLNWVLKRVKYIKDYYVKVSYWGLLCEFDIPKRVC